MKEMTITLPSANDGPITKILPNPYVNKISVFSDDRKLLATLGPNEEAIFEPKFPCLSG